MRDSRVRLSDGREVLSLLDGAGGQEGEARLPAGHDVGVVAEDRQRVGREDARRHMHDERGEFARNLVHVGDHQEKPLGGGEGGRHGSALKGAVDRAGRSPFGLHLDDLRHGVPQVGPLLDRQASASSPIGEDGVIG
jgi:hypothetical protein